MIDLANIFKGCIDALDADGTFNGLIAGRVYTRVPRSPTFPFVRLVSLPATRGDGFLAAGHPKWLWGQTFDFVCFSLSTSPAEVGDVLDALGDVMEDKSNITVTGATVVQVLPGPMALEQDERTQTWSGVASYDFLLDES